MKIINENNCGKCVDPFDIRATKKAVEELLSNDKLAEEMGLNGREAVLKQFNWEIEEKKLINIYRSIIK
jgi:glycosyltransferase involved in cell wall biosynthesis